MLPEFSEPSDRFVTEARIGSGGMGDIFKGVDRENGEAVAIKLLRASASAQERARFGREIAILADLRHPNIVQYIAHGTWHDGRLFFAMEWLDGEDLGQRQRRAPLGMRDSVEVVRRSAAAMAAIHARGVTHRDLKLSNIFLVRGRGTAIKLIDFGVVKPSVPDEFPTERGTIIGTPHFMAPEQARGEAIDSRADVYSLGSVLFRLVTGRNVFETEHVIALLGRLVLEDPPGPQSIRFDVPDLLEQVVLKAISRQKENRFDNGGELARALARVGSLSNDPPATDRSSSAIRRAVPEVRSPASAPGSGETPSAQRPGTSERRVVAVMLFDLGDKEKLAPEIEAAVRDVLGEDTRLEPLLGSQLVAVLGVERSQGDEAMRAARAALTVAQAMPKAKVTVAVGHAIRGRGNLAGEALERAASQLELARPGAVRLDAYALAALEGRFIVQEDAQGGELLREDASGFGARQLLGRVTPTVGREKEIALLQGIYGELVEDGTPRAALVTGPAGIGKSRVRSELMQRLELAPEKPVTLVCRGDPMSRASSMSALGRALRQHMGVHDGESSHEQVHKVKQQVSQRMPRTLRFLAGFLGELVGVSFPDDADEPLRAARASAQLMQSRLRMALEAYVRAHDEALVLIIEDMHWADDTTLEMVDWLLGCPDLKFGVVAFGRPEITTRAPQLWEKRNVYPADAGAAVAARRGPARGGGASERRSGDAREHRPARQRQRPVPRGADPLLGRRSRGAAADGAGAGAASPRPDDARGPRGASRRRGVRPIVLDRRRRGAARAQGRGRSRRADGERDRHQAAGEPHRRPRRVDVPASPGSRRRLRVDPRGGSFGDAPRGGRVARGRRRRRRGAHRAARRRGRRSPARRDPLREGDASGVHERRAARDGVRAGEFLCGLACGAEGGVRAQLLLARAQVASALGKLEDAIASAEEAGRLAPAGSDMWGEAQRLMTVSLVESGRSREGDARAAWALGPDFWPSLSQGVRATLLASRVRGLVDLDMTQQALEVADSAIEEARASGELSATTRALDARMYALMHMGDMSKAIAASVMLIEAAETTGDMVLATRGRINTGSVLNQLGLFEEAQAMLERALPDTRNRRMRILEASTLHNLGLSSARLGRLDDGITYERQSARIADECSAARLRLNSRIYEALMLVWRGGPGDLGLALSTAQWLCTESRVHAGLYTTAIFTLSRVQLARRELGAALELAREANHRLESGPVEEWEEGIRLTLVEALLQSGLDKEADRELDRAFGALVSRARGITIAEHRESFLKRNEEARTIVEALASSRLGRALPSMSGSAALPPRPRT